MCLLMISETDNSTLLESVVSLDDIYQLQGDSLIVWNDLETNMDMALSFQETDGCQQVWDEIRGIQGREADSREIIAMNLNESRREALMMSQQSGGAGAAGGGIGGIGGGDEDEDEMMMMIDDEEDDDDNHSFYSTGGASAATSDHHHTSSVGAVHHLHHHHRNQAVGRQQLAPLDLPDPEPGNLSHIFKVMQECRKRVLMITILEPGFLTKYFDVFDRAETVNDLESLRLLFVIFKLMSMCVCVRVMG